MLNFNGSSNGGSLQFYPNLCIKINKNVPLKKEKKSLKNWAFITWIKISYIGTEELIPHYNALILKSMRKAIYLSFVTHICQPDYILKILGWIKFCNISVHASLQCIYHMTQTVQVWLVSCFLGFMTYQPL